ncbi:MAG: hypothetical protein AAF205_11065 [Pseudomonadota bacterium]
MKKLYVAFVGLAALFLTAFTTTLQTQLASDAASWSPDTLAFITTTRLTEQRKNKPPETNVFVERYDPSAQPSWTLVSVDGAPPSKKDVKRAQKRHKDRKSVPGYHRNAKWLGQPATLSGDVLIYDGFEKKTFDMGPIEIAKKLKGIAHIDRSGPEPFIDHVTFTLTKPTRAALVAKIDAMSIDTTFRRLPSGRPVPDRVEFTTKGSIFGRSGTQTAFTRYSEFRELN